MTKYMVGQTIPLYGIPSITIHVLRSDVWLPSDFSLSLMDLYPGSDNQQWVNPGDPCVVNLGDDMVLTGYIDRWAPMISRNRREVRATGRSKCQDLVDCSAEWPNNVISQSTALQIAQRLAQPYSITVTTDVTDLDIVPQFTLNWGESSQEIIDRISRPHLSLTAYYRHHLCLCPGSGPGEFCD